MNNPLISVIIPVYNVEDYLERCLDSVTSNTYRNLEIICVNDGSPDNCQVILERYAKEDSRIKVISQANKGLSAARNAGIDISKGDYLYFLDSDDWIHQNAFNVLLYAANKSNADIIVGGFKYVSSFHEFDGSTVYEIQNDIAALDRDTVINGRGRTRDNVWGTLYHRNIIGKYRFPEEIKAYSEDAFFNALIYSSKADIRYTFIDLPLYAYFNAPGSIMNTLTPDKMLRAIRVWVEHLSDFEAPQYAVRWIFLQLYRYGQIGKNCSNPQVAKNNIRLALKLSKSYIWSCRKLPLKQIIKVGLAIYVPNVYFKLLCWMDSTFLIGEEMSKARNKSIILTEWDNL